MSILGQEKDSGKYARMYEIQGYNISKADTYTSVTWGKDGEILSKSI